MSQTPTQTLPDTDPGLSKSGLDAEERVVRLVMEGIGQHRIPPGHRLVERELTEGAHANRQAVRNALLRLSQAGLVQLTPNRGATVMQCTPDMTRQIMQARIINEGAALRMLAPGLMRQDQGGCSRSCVMKPRLMTRGALARRATFRASSTSPLPKWPVTK
ncbi:GntR family transcriptional regulator [Paracoccus kondratievae]